MARPGNDVEDDPVEDMNEQRDRYLGIVNAPQKRKGNDADDEGGTLHFPEEPDPGNEFARRKKPGAVALRPKTRLKDL